ncbi:MAG: hypothetical protein KJO54_05170 [Gammaproteobacteria bacterium]|nr:hypothetical protein [Gammaproteobacteria bacterium]NNF59843.1 hypothetical protein [Gammaproteobacteria bacterium]NNM21283.1 hypothetical protein [Gammaproteobacteria bacterium]
MRCHWNPVSLLLAGLLLVPAVYAENEVETQWLFDAEVSTVYDDNIGRAERERDIVDDKMLRGSFAASYIREISVEQVLTLRAFVESEFVRYVDGLSHVAAGAQFVYRWQHRMGLFAPFYQFNTSIRLKEYDVEQRDVTAYSSQLLVSRRLTDRVLATVGFEYQREVSDGIVFDQKRARVFANADYTNRTGWAFYGTYSYIHGDVWSTSQDSFCNGAPALDIFNLVAQAAAIEPDEAFNKAYCGSWLAYRLPANVNMLVLGINKPLGRRVALDVSAAHIRVNAVANEYNVSSFNASLLLRF